MNKTPNYQLNQWEATDKVQRVDFNADNAKLDGALSALSAALDAARGTVPKIAVGTYTGTGSESRHISVGFAPKAVLVMTNHGETFSDGAINYRGGLAVTGSPVITAQKQTGGCLNVVALTGSGFSVYYHNDVASRFCASSNDAGITYHYLAIG